MIDKITLAVRKGEAMAAFYGALLDTDFVPFEVAGHKLYSGKRDGVEWLLCPRELAGIGDGSNTIQLRIVVDDLRAAHAKGLSHGGEELNAPAEQEGRLFSALRDPDGNSLELVQAL